MPNARTLFVGALTLDTVFKVEDFSLGPGKYLARDSVSMASGMASNAATAAARLGGEVSLWASVGADPRGEALVREIELEGVDCRFVRRVAEGRTANAAIIVDGQGERWVIVDYDPVTQAPPTSSEVPPVESFTAVMADVRWQGAARMALKAAKEAGRLAILDADTATLEVLEDLAPFATHIVASASGAKTLSGGGTPAEAACVIASNYRCFTCVTDGANGSYSVVNPKEPPFFTATPKVEVIDTNAAGDVYHGAFVQALAEGQPPLQAVRFASAAAALKCQVLGGRLGAPNRAATLQLVKETYDAQG